MSLIRIYNNDIIINLLQCKFIKKFANTHYGSGGSYLGPPEILFDEISVQFKTTSERDMEYNDIYKILNNYYTLQTTPPNP